MSLPKVVFIREKAQPNGEKWLQADSDQGALIEDEDDVVAVGEYVLQATRRLRKVVEEVR